MSRSSLAVAVLACAVAGLARAQDFASPTPPPPCASVAAFLERGLPAADSPPLFEADVTSWLGVPDLVTRAMAAAVAMGGMRAAAGVSRTGPPGVGWSAAGLACGSVTDRGGIGLRGVARRNDGGSAERSTTGAEVGAAAWIDAGPRVRVWAEAPQIATSGEPPPLRRALAIGIACSLEGATAWLERQAPARPTDGTGLHAAGALLDLGFARTWIEARERPLRGALGIDTHTRGIGIGVRVESHPRLGDTVSLSVAIGRGAAP